MDNAFSPLTYLDEIGFDWKSKLDYHLSCPNVNIEEYRLIKKTQFISLLPKKVIKIYLDLNVWIHFRDAHIGKKLSNCKWIDVYQKAIFLNEFHNICFITSLPIFFELFKQKVEEEYVILFNIIGKLSKELSIEYPMQLVYDEVLFFLSDMLKITPKYFDSQNYQWDKASAIMGVPILVSKHPNNPMIALGKTLIDALYHIPFRDYYKLFNRHEDSSEVMDYQGLSKRLNWDLINKKGVRGNNLKELYNEEFQGAIRASADIINDALAMFINERYGVNHITINNIRDKELINMFPNLFRLGRIQNYLPSLQVHAGLHASVRYDKSKKFTANDLFDFKHASSAIPYCQYFITDNPLAQRLKNKPLEFEKKFGTKILPAEPELILQTFEELISQNDSRQTDI